TSFTWTAPKSRPARGPEARIISAAPGIFSTPFGIPITASPSMTTKTKAARSAASSTPVTAGTCSIRCRSRSRCASPLSTAVMALKTTASRSGIIIRRWLTTTWIGRRTRVQPCRLIRSACRSSCRCQKEKRNSFVNLGVLFHGRRLTAQQIQHRHAHGQAVRDLLENRGVGAVGHFGSNLDAAVDRAGRQQKDVRLGSLEPVTVHAEEVSVFVNRGEETAALPLELDAQHV